MGEPWHHQVRFTLDEAMAERFREGADDAALRPLRAVLAAHGAVARSQLDAFSAYVAEAEREGPEGFALYRWTKATLDDPAKRAAHGRSFALHVGGREVYALEEADRVAGALGPLVGGGVVAGMTRHDTNPANNMPVPAEYRAGGV
ncbi:MAG: hypothetical protein ACRYG6_00735 [Janthinobacterium lividum]